MVDKKINPKTTWVDYLTVAELKKIWEPGSQVDTWKDVRANWPDRKIRLYGPGTDSGTFYYFTGAINGNFHASRSDFTMSEDDDVLVQGVAGDRGCLPGEDCNSSLKRGFANLQIKRIGSYTACLFGVIWKESPIMPPTLRKILFI